MEKPKTGFTLIELLIVVAIIGILAAIAVPNFLNAQMRARIARTNGDLKALSSALEAYFIDHNKYHNNHSHLTVYLRGLTTPVSYISTVSFRDTFKAEQQNKSGDMTGNDQESYLYFYYYYEPEPISPGNWMNQVNRQDLSTHGYCLSSWGPDRKQDAIEWVYIQSVSGDQQGANSRIYAPSNGLLSGGDIGRWGGSVPGVPIVAGG